MKSALGLLNALAEPFQKLGITVLHIVSSLAENAPFCKVKVRYGFRK